MLFQQCSSLIKLILRSLILNKYLLYHCSIISNNEFNNNSMKFKEEMMKNLDNIMIYRTIWNLEKYKDAIVRT